MSTATLRLPGHLAHPFSPTGRVNPYPAYRWLQTYAPVYHDPATRMWLLTGHADCSAALRSDAFSAAQGQQGRARDDALPPSMLTTDAPDHHRLRAPGGLLLGPEAIRSVADGIGHEVDALLDRSGGRAGELDAATGIGQPLATAVYARLFGLEDAERPRFEELARAVSVNLDPMAGPAAAAAGRAAMGELNRFLDAVAKRHAVTGFDCPLSRLAADDRLTRPEMLGILGLAVVGGWQPLAETVGNALYWLLPRPAAVEYLRRSDEQSARTAVDELLRLEAPIPFTARVTTREVELPGGRVPADARVLAVLAAANRDPAVFERPDELLLDRSPNPHLAFGGGPHFCLAALLVRQTGALLLPRLLRRFPAVAAYQERARWDDCVLPRRLAEYPLELGPRHSDARGRNTNDMEA
ncbi:cytochrome P450 [Streptomyces spororaveus]|uniref:cytochrome P450 n=1 Tax=Streptomyces spororaveus TaxID=284039 RepID=UPI0019230D9F|nr:cytochrome P450 [Streptomyces spororaveus]